ncbi:MAG: diacylglycerol/lipid kinase family protein [Solirubrobacteraceae bacterium]
MTAASGSRRLWALAALVLLAGAVCLAIAVAIIRFPRGLSVLLALGAAMLSAWYGIQRRGFLRAGALAAAAVLAAGAVVLIVIEGKPVPDAVVLACVLGSLAAARQAFAVHQELPPGSAPEHPVLFYNPLSGDGKAKRFHLANEATRRGIEPIELRRGDDLEQLVRQAVRYGADALAMAGGDGSQAIVAAVAAELDLPYACIPAGTRNHFALDLGVNRDDVVGALDAFAGGGERRVDLAEVNGRVFVNNVSLGMYADAVQQAGYRNAKLRTLLDTVPEVLGPDASPPAVRWTHDDGEESAVALLVSNNPYRLGRALGSGTRPRMDGATLGIAAFGGSRIVDGGADSPHVGLSQWAQPTFEVRSETPVPAGIDGEAVVLEPPLRFRTRPGALRVRIASAHPGASPSAILPDTLWGAVRSLAGFAFAGG